MLQNVLLLPETKGSCAHVLLIPAYVSDYVHMHKLCRLRTEETHAILLAKSTAHLFNKINKHVQRCRNRWVVGANALTQKIVWGIAPTFFKVLNID